MYNVRVCRMKQISEVELAEMDKNIREGFYDSRLKNPYCLRALIDMAREAIAAQSYWEQRYHQALAEYKKEETE